MTRVRTSTEIINDLNSKAPSQEPAAVHRVSAANFGEKPLTTFDENFNLINGLMKFLQVFAGGKENKKAQKALDNIAIEIAKQRDEFNKNAGFIAKMSTDWIQLENAERDRMHKLGYTGTEKDVIKKMLQIDMLKQFVVDHVKDKYSKTSEPHNLIDAVYNLIEFNALTPEARLYSDTHAKELPKVSATDLQGKQLFASIKMAMGNLEKTKLSKGTTQLQDMSSAMELISDSAKKGTVAYDNFKGEHAVKTTEAKSESPDSVLTEADRKRIIEEQQSAFENLQQERDNLANLIAQGNDSTLQVDVAYLSIIENSIAEYGAENQKKLQKMKPNDEGYNRVKRLTNATTAVGEAITQKDQAAINKAFEDLQTMVDDIISGKDYGKLHTKRKGGLDTILTAKMAAGVELDLINTRDAAVGVERRPSLSSTSSGSPAVEPSSPLSPSDAPKVLSSNFSDKPLVTFNTNMNLVSQLMNYLMVFVDDKEKAAPMMQAIIADVMKQQERYNKVGGLLAKGDLSWIVTNADEKSELKKGKLADVFQLDAINLFIENHVQKKYQDVPGRVETSAPKDLVNAVFDMIKMNALSADARFYGETAMKKYVSATDLVAQTAKANLTSSLTTLTTEKTKNKTTQRTELLEAELQIKALGSTFASEWNNFRTQQRVQEKAEAKTTDTELVIAKNANEALAQEIKEMQKPSTQISTVSVNKDYIRVVLLALEQYRSENSDKLTATAVKDPGLRRINNLALKVTQLQKAIAADSQPDTTERYKELKEFVDRIVSGKDYSAGHMFTKHKSGLDAILERKMKAAEELGLTRDAVVPERSPKHKA
jgi:hypothetical protein